MNHNLSQSQSNLYKIYIESTARNDINDDMSVAPIEFYANRVNIPGITIPVAQMDSPINKIPFPAQSGMQFDGLVVNMILDENYTNYLEILKWVKRNTDQMKINLAMNGSEEDSMAGQWKPRDYRNITINLKSTYNKDFAKFIAYDCFPVVVSAIGLTTTEANQLECAITFKILTFEFQQLDGTIIV